MGPYEIEQYPFNPEDFGVSWLEYRQKSEIEKVPVYNQYLASLPMGLNTRNRWNDPDREDVT